MTEPFDPEVIAARMRELERDILNLVRPPLPTEELTGMRRLRAIEDTINHLLREHEDCYDGDCSLYSELKEMMENLK